MATLVRGLSVVTPVRLGKIEGLLRKISEQDQKIIEQSPTIFPLKRYNHQYGNRDYYAYGNTPPEDFLESCTECIPKVLSLGCGDIRSCFYTLWKHFDETISNATCQFESVSFTLVDHSAAVLARNVIFIYLALNLPKERKKRRAWLCGMWAIWYCHELGPESVKMLSDSLKYLVSFSTSLDEWNSDKNILKALIYFESPTCLSKVNLAWRMWLDEKVKVRSRKQMQKLRRDLLSSEINDMSLFCQNYSLIGTYTYGRIAVGHYVSTLSSEVRAYLTSGSCYAESVFDLDLPTHLNVNLTLFEREDGVYTLHYASLPFSSFQQTFLLHHEDRSQDITVAGKHFRDKPFLANSVQQFVLWVQSTSRVLKNQSAIFTLYCKDVLTFCHEKQVHEELLADQLYDAICTSNLIDHVGVPNLVLSCVPLLKDKSFLFTSSLISRNCTDNLDEFLKLCFGFDCSLLPVLLGIRCINHEGRNYTSPVMIQPFPPDMASESPGLPHVRFLVWEKCPNSLPLTIPRLPAIEQGSVTDGLVNLVGTCAFAHLNPGPGLSSYVVCHNTTVTAVLMLHCFVNHLAKNITTEYAFWDPLCAALRQITGPFAVCLETYLLLYKIHIHLVVTDKECPICKKEPINNVIGLFSIKFSMEDLGLGKKRPFFYALVHNNSCVNKQDLLHEALNGKNVHIFDSFDTSIAENRLELIFYAPLQFAHQNYKVAIVFVYPQSTAVHCLIDTTMTKALSSFKEYQFFQPNRQAILPNGNAKFGSVLSHTYNGSTSETVIALSSQAKETFLANKLTKERVSLCEYRLSCGVLYFNLCLSYPVELDGVSIKHSDTSLLHVTCKRRRHRFIDEKPHCIVTPDHQLSIPEMKENVVGIVRCQSGMQLTQEESSSNLKTMVQDLPPLKRAKMAIQNIFEASQSCHFYQLINRQTNDILMIAVNTTLFDYEHQTPAVDLAYCKTSQNSVIARKWEKLFQSCNGRQNLLNDTQFTMLMEILKYFMKRTNGNTIEKVNTPIFSELFAVNINQFFSRAVLYFLLCDPDKKIVVPCLPFVPPVVSGAYCYNCSIFSFTLKKCVTCKKAHYCSRDCQKSHWKIHRQECKKCITKPSTDIVFSAAGFFSMSASKISSSMQH